MSDPERPDVEAAALWVHLDPVSHRPADITQEEFDIFATTGYGARRVSHRLQHPRPEPGSGTELFSWRFRRVDTDVAEHVNNAAYWEPLEEELLSFDPQPVALDAEIEFRDGAQPGRAHYMQGGPGDRFILNAAGELLATARLAVTRADSETGPA